MSNPTIADIYTNNDKIRENFLLEIGSFTEQQVSSLPEGEKWTISQIVEHVSIVEDGITGICRKLLAKAQAEGKGSDGAVKISDSFVAKGAELAQIKVDAPERVHPVGGKTIAELISKMRENRARLDELRPQFENYDCNENKFPHPFLGVLSAAEWLVLIGGHEARHLAQIRNLIEKIG